MIIFKLLRTDIRSGSAFRLESNQPTPLMGQVVNLELLLCTGFDAEHADLFQVFTLFSALYYCFAQGPINDPKAEPSDEGRFSLKLVPVKLMNFRF